MGVLSDLRHRRARAQAEYEELGQKLSAA